MEKKSVQHSGTAEADRQMARMLSLLMKISASGLLLVFLFGLYFRDHGMITLSVTGIGLHAVPLWLFWRRRFLAGGWAFSIIVLVTFTLLATFGQGSSDIILVAYPLILLFTSITLNRRILIINTMLMMGSILWLVFGPHFDFFTVKPVTSEPVTQSLMLSGIVLILAIAIDTLTVSMRRNLEQANRAISLQEQEWRHNRIIAETQGVLLRSCSLEQIYTLVSEKTHQLIGDCICVTSMHDESGQTMRIAAVHGFNYPAEKFAKLLGMDPREKVFRISDLSDEVLSKYRSGKLEVLKGGLHALLMGQVPQPVSTVAQKRLNVSAVCGIGFVHETGSLGGLTILARSDISAHAETIELIVGMATLAMVRKRDLTALQRNENHYKQLFEESPCGVALISPKGVIEQANTTLARMYRCGSPLDLAGTTVESLVAPSARGQAARNMQKMFGGEDLPAIGYELVRKDGTTFSGEIRAALLRNAEGAVTGGITVVRDISGDGK